MTDAPHPRITDAGFTQCVYCGETFGPDPTMDANLMHGPVTDATGEQHDHVVDAPHTDLFHPDCYAEWRGRNERTLGEFYPQ